MDELTINAHARRIWLAYAGIYSKLQKYPTPKIVLCNRLTKTIGKCYYWENRIHLANKFFPRNLNIMLSDILPHEIAHQVSYNLYGEAEQERKAHGIKWQEIMFSYGIFPHVTYDISI